MQNEEDVVLLKGNKLRAVNQPRNLRLALLSAREGCRELDNPLGATNPRINSFFSLDVQ